MDIKFMKELGTKVNIIPFIVKADIKIYEVPEAELRDYVPFTVYGADTKVYVEGKTIRDRQYS